MWFERHGRKLKQEARGQEDERKSSVVSVAWGREKNVKEKDDERVGVARVTGKREGGGTNKWKVGVTHRGISVPW